MKVLIVEDEPKAGDYLRQGLVEAGFVVDLVRDGIDGLHHGLTEAYDLAILDVMLPGIDGWALLVLASALAGPAMARQKIEDHCGHHPAAAAPAADMTDGEIRKIDRDPRWPTIKRGEIQHLGMPAMTMVFQLGDSSLLDQLKAGDKVRFKAESSSTGLVVIAIKVVR